MARSNVLDRMNSPSGKIMISIIWGLGIACLFFKTCKDRSCITLKAPKQAVISGMTHHHNEKCFQMKPKETQCVVDVIKELEEDENASTESPK